MHKYKKVNRYRRGVYCQGRALALFMVCMGTFLCIAGYFSKTIGGHDLMIFWGLGGFLAIIGIVGWFGIAHEAKSKGWIR